MKETEQKGEKIKKTETENCKEMKGKNKENIGKEQLKNIAEQLKKEYEKGEKQTEL